MESQTLPSLPIIDFTDANLCQGSSSWLTTVENVHNALEEYGCFIAVNNKVSSELKDAMFKQVKHLFDLPAKIKSENVCDIPHIAYFGGHLKFPLIESLGINVMDEEGIQSFTDRMWSSGNDQFCATINPFIKSASEVDEMITRMIFESYGVDKYLKSHAASTGYWLRLTKYRPPVAGETDIGSPPHTDKNFLTIIHQNQVDGLEIQIKNTDHWVTMELPPLSCIIVAGEAFMAWSNGRIHSVSHRVRLNRLNEEDRYTIMLFSTTRGETDIPEELIDDDHPRQFTSFDAYALRNFYFTEEGQKTHNTARAYCGI